MAAKKKTAKKGNGWGGRRKGAGRPNGTGPGRGEHARYSRIAVMFSDADDKKIQGLAKDRDIPAATFVHGLVARALKRYKA